MANGTQTAEQDTDTDRETPTGYSDHAAAISAARDAAAQYTDRTQAIAAAHEAASQYVDSGPALAIAHDIANQYTDRTQATQAARETAASYVDPSLARGAAEQQATQYTPRAPIYSAVSNIIGPGAGAEAVAQDTANQYQRESQRSAMRELVGTPAEQVSADIARQYQPPVAPIDMGAYQRARQQAEDAALAVSSTTAPVEDLSTRTITPAEAAARQSAGQYGNYQTVYSPEDPEVRRAALVRLPTAPIATQAKVATAQPQVVPRAAPVVTPTPPVASAATQPVVAPTPGGEQQPVVPRAQPVVTPQPGGTPPVAPPRAQPVQGQQGQPAVPRAQPVVTPTPQPGGQQPSDASKAADEAGFTEIKPLQTGQPSDMAQRNAQFIKDKAAWDGERSVNSQGQVLKRVGNMWVKVQPSADGYGEEWMYPDGSTRHVEPTWTQHEKNLDSQLKGGDLATGKIYDLSRMTVPQKEYALQRNLTFNSSSGLDATHNTVLSNTRDMIDTTQRIRELLGKVDNSDLSKGAQIYLSNKLRMGGGYRGADVKPETAELFSLLDHLRNSAGNTLGLDMPTKDTKGVSLPTLISPSNIKGMIGTAGLSALLEGGNQFLQALAGNTYNPNQLRETLNRQIFNLKRGYYSDVAAEAGNRTRLGSGANSPTGTANQYRLQLPEDQKHVSDYISGPGKQEQAPRPGAGGVWGLNR